jgi:FixJ family two-component response regulator
VALVDPDVAPPQPVQAEVAFRIQPLAGRDDDLPTHLTLTEISRELGISRNTVKTQVASVYRKVGAPTRAEAVRVGRELGMLGA